MGAPLNEPTGAVMNTALDKVSFGTPLMDDPGGDVSMDDKDKDKDKDNPGGGRTDADPSLSNKVNLDGSSANDNPGSRDFNTLHQLASSNTKASRFSPIISVTKAPLNEPTGEVMNTTMDTVSFGTPLMDDPGGDVSMDDKDKDKDKDNPGGGSTDADPSLSNKVNLDGTH